MTVAAAAVRVGSAACLPTDDSSTGQVEMAAGAEDRGRSDPAVLGFNEVVGVDRGAVGVPEPEAALRTHVRMVANRARAEPVAYMARQIIYG